MYAIIPAGGSGSRLWPLSRSKFPKHLLDLTGEGSMIQVTVERISSVIDPGNTIIITEQGHAGEIKKQLRSVPGKNFLIEPDRRDTAPVIGLGAFMIAQRDPDAVIASLHADHIITKPKEFSKILKVAQKIASQNDVIVTLGIHPTEAATCYGYISSGEEFGRQGETEIFQVKAFTEKPNLPTAQAFLAAGNYFWNAGMFICKVQVLLDAYRRHAPRIYEGLAKIAKTSGTKAFDAQLKKIYPTLPKTPIDIAIMEKIKNIVTIPADIGWSDVGSWDTVKEILPDNDGTNAVLGQHEGLDTRDSLIHSSGGRLVATIGLEKMIVIDTGDAVLVCPLDRAQDIKDLVRQMEKSKKGKYL